VDDLQSEKEQIEEMKAWWAEYGRYVIAGIVIAVGLIFGFNQYKSSKLEAQIEASVLFEQLEGHVREGDLDAAETAADELASNYANTAYAAQSKLAMARLYMDNSRDQDAADVLADLLEMRGNGPLKHVGRVRLARILMYQNKPEEVLDLLADQSNEAFAGLYAELEGDAYAALGRYAEAAEAYRLALADTTRAVNGALVQMKLVDLPGPEQAAPAPEPGERPDASDAPADATTDAEPADTAPAEPQPMEADRAETQPGDPE